MEKTKAIIIRANHFDPVWRRCWDRPFYDGGRRFASYREIEGYFFDDALESGEAFSCESAWTIRKYLEKHPERLEEVKRLHGEGKFELLGAGENIIDTNMPGTECLIRNLVIGLLWGRDTFGETPSIPCFTDVFGSSCQLPQLVRGCGMLPWIFQLDYNVPDGPVWKGVDGSCVAWGFPDTAPGCCPCGVIPFGKHEPCPHCRGEGCPECGGRGFLPVYTAVLNKMPENVPEGAKVLRCNLAGEEILPDKELGRHIREMNAASADLHFEAGVMKDLLPYVREHIALADSPGDVSGRAENNPAQTGCYVSRIKVKQLEREIESLMAACEARDALLDNGRQHEALREIWRDITFICQHDAVTGDHIDQAYGEITEFEEDIRKRLLGCLESVKAPGEGFVVYNHNGFAADLPARTPFRHPEVRDAEGEPVPVYSDGSFTAKGVEAFSAKAYSICEGEPQTPRKGKEGVYSMDGFTLTAGPCGIEKAEHSRFGRFTGTDFYFGEPVLETDIGDPWCTRHKDRTRDRLSAYTRLEGVEIYPHEIRINYSGRHPKGTGHLASDAAMIFDFAWSQTFVLREGTGRIDVETRVRWFTGNCRLRLAFPSASSADEGVYEVPGAVIKRPRYEHTGYDPLSGAGDWPCLRWFGIETDGYVFTVMNRGTPSARVEKGTAFVSILRSPTLPAWLYEPNFYTARNYCEIGDPGEHSFVHAVALCENRLAAFRKGAEFGSIPFCGAGEPVSAGIFLKGEGAFITAVKKGEYEGTVLRIVEYSGAGCRGVLEVPAACSRAVKTNLLEDDIEDLGLKNGRAALCLRPYEIATVKLL